VITSPYSFVASANCAIYEGATPVFADVDPRTFNLDPAAVEAAVTPRTKAVVAVDIYGYPCELDELRAVCDRRGLALIEDACEALGARYKGEPLGSHGHLAVWAFYPNKQMTTGEGGAVTTSSERQWRELVSLRNQGRADSGGWLEHARLGFNYRLDDVSAALGLGQVEKLDQILELRGQVAARYGELLAAIDGVEAPLADDADHERSWFVYVVTLDSGIDRERVIAGLEERGVASARYLPSIHLQPYMRERYGFREGMCPVSEDLSARTFALPFHTRLAADDQEYAVEALAASLQVV
jgi:perosamine synthetase